METRRHLRSILATRVGGPKRVFQDPLVLIVAICGGQLRAIFKALVVEETVGVVSLFFFPSLLALQGYTSSITQRFPLGYTVGFLATS